MHGAYCNVGGYMLTTPEYDFCAVVPLVVRVFKIDVNGRWHSPLYNAKAKADGILRASLCATNDDDRSHADFYFESQFCCG
jgi:hypothetical protein